MKTFSLTYIVAIVGSYTCYELISIAFYCIRKKVMQGFNK